MATFDLYSDLHFNHWPEHPASYVGRMVPAQHHRGDCALIAGDLEDDKYGVEQSVSAFESYYKKVLFVDGNHHYYRPSFDENIIERMKTEKKFFSVGKFSSPKSHFLPTGHYMVDDVAVVGVNGWYDWNMPGGVLNRYEVQKNTWKKLHSDYNMIDFNSFEPPDLAKLQAVELGEMLKEASTKSKKIVVVTHTIPHRILPRITGTPDWDLLTGSFVNSCMEQIFNKYKEVIKFWCFGHTHESIIRRLGDTHFVCNPFGYPSERSNLGQYRPIQFEV